MMVVEDGELMGYEVTGRPAVEVITAGHDFRKDAAYDFRKDAASGLYVPKPVPASKMKKGIKKAQSKIRAMIREFADLMTDDYTITEMEFTAAFNADGKFMGFGVGADASIKIKIAPSSA